MNNCPILANSVRFRLSADSVIAYHGTQLSTRRQDCGLFWQSLTIARREVLI